MEKQLADHSIPIGSIKEILGYNIRNKLAAFVLIFCFCDFVLNAIFNRIMGEFVGQAFYKMLIVDMVLLLPVTLCSFMCGKKTKSTVWPFYFIIYLSVILTWILHPEYTPWFLHDDFGIFSCFFTFSSVIYIPLVFSLFSDERKLFNSILVATKIKFCFLVLQYITASIRGYWNIKNYLGIEEQWSYNLAFGYEMVFCSIVFLITYLYSSKRSYLCLALVCFYTILTAGSRGPWVCVIAMLGFNYLVFWKKYSINSLKIVKFAGAMGGLLAIVCFAGSTIVEWLISLVTYLNIESRTIDMLISDYIFDDNGRNALRDAALTMIDNGWMFGYGVYGDRVVISEVHFIGYPHNFFLELFIQFGVIGGGIILGYLFYKVLQMIKLCDNDIYKILLVIYLSNSVKLLISDSFWYNGAFWSLIAVLIIWNWQQKRSSKI